MARRKLCASTKFEILPLSTFTLCQQKSYISNGIQTIFEIFPSARRYLGGHSGEKFLVRKCFTFAMGRWKLCASTKFEILPLSTCTVYIVPAKIPYLQRYSTDFRNLCLSSKMFRVVIWEKVSGAQEFYFCNGEVKSLRIDNIWNFANFNLYTGPAKVLHLQRCSTDFRNLCLGSRMWRAGIWV